jgi:hypothetical protein
MWVKYRVVSTDISILIPKKILLEQYVDKLSPLLYGIVNVMSKIK